MNNLWLKIKIWTKGILAALVLIYLLIFILKNDQDVPFWWWFNHDHSYSKLLLIGIAFFAGVLSTILLRTALRTLKQINDVRNRSRTDRMERDLNEMKFKASRLQTKPAGSTTANPAAPNTSLPPDESAD